MPTAALFGCPATLSSVLAQGEAAHQAPIILGATPGTQLTAPPWSLPSPLTQAHHHADVKPEGACPSWALQRHLSCMVSPPYQCREKSE